MAKRSLTQEQAEEIRAKYEPWRRKGNSIRNLAKEYGVGKTTIHKILRNERYKTAKEETSSGGM